MRNGVAITAIITAVALTGVSEAQSFTRFGDASVNSATVYRGLQEQAPSITLRGGAELGPVEITLRTDVAVSERDALHDRGQIDLTLRPFARSSLFRPELGLTSYAEWNTPESGRSIDRETEVFAGFLLDTVLRPRLRAAYDWSEERTTVEAGVFHSITLPSQRDVIDLSLDAGWVEDDGGSSYEYLTGRAEFIYLLGQGFESYAALSATLSSEDTMIGDYVADTAIYEENFKAVLSLGLRRTF